MDGKKTVSLMLLLLYITSGGFSAFGLLWYSLPYEVLRLVTGDRIIMHNSGEMIYPILAWILMLISAAILLIIGRIADGACLRIICFVGLFFCYTVLLLYIHLQKGIVQDVLLSVNAFLFLLLYAAFGISTLKFVIA